MKNLLKTILVAVALLVVPATAFAETCWFAAGDTVLRHPKASDAVVQQYLSDLGPARSSAGIDTKKFAELVAILMTQKNMAEGIAPECRTTAKLAEGFLAVNVLPGTLSDAEFVNRVRTTGFMLPKAAPAANAAPPSAPAAAAPPVAKPVTPPSSSAAPATPAVSPAVVEKIVERLPEAERKKIELLVSEQTRIKSEIESLKGKREFTAADATRLKALEGQLSELNQSLMDRLSNYDRRIDAIIGADGKGGLMAGVDQRLDSLEAKTKRLESAEKQTWGMGETILAIVLALIAGGCGFLTYQLFLRAKKSDLKAVKGVADKAASDVGSVQTEMASMKERLPGDIKLHQDWKTALEQASNAVEIPVLVEQEGGRFEARFLVTVEKVGTDEVEILSGIQGHNRANRIKLSNLPATVRRAGFNNRLNAPVVRKAA